MASLRKRPESGFWVACYSLPDGTRLQRSTKTKDKSIALQIALSAERAAKEKVTVDTAKKIISDVVERIQGERVCEEKFIDYLSRWKGRKEKEVSPGTAERYQNVIDSMIAEFGEAVMNGLMSNVTTPQLSKWRDNVAARLSIKSVNAYIAIARQVFAEAMLEGVIFKNPMIGVRKLRSSKVATRRAFSVIELKALFAASDGEWEGMFLAGLYTGQGLSDIAAMDLDNIDAAGWWRSSRRKTGVPINIPLTPSLLEWIKKRHPKSQKGRVFPEAFAIMEKANGKTSRLSDSFQKIMVKAGLTKPRNHKKQENGPGRDGKRSISEISFHSLRHTNNTLLKSAGVSESIAMALVSHESADINRGYTHFPDSVLKDAVAKLPDITSYVDTVVS